MLHNLRLGTNNGDIDDLAVYTCTREEKTGGDLTGIQETVESVLLSTPAAARRFFQALHFHIQGYDGDPRELYQIDECRSWFQRLDREFPCLIYFVPCRQYTLYMGSQRGLDGASLSVSAVRSFFEDRSDALEQLAQRIEEPYTQMKANLRSEFREHSTVDLGPW